MQNQFPEVSIEEMLKTVQGRLQEKLESEQIARLEAEILIGHILEMDRVRLLTYIDRIMTAESIMGVNAVVARRLTGEPIAYITGFKEFMGLDFLVNKNVLVPRPETEFLVERAIALARQRKNPVIVDMCTGSGAVAVAAAVHIPYATVYGTDISEEALLIAMENAKKHNVSDRVSFFSGDGWQSLPDSLYGEIDALLCNPPYVCREDIGNLMSDVRDFEPHLALDGGDDGLDFYRKIIPDLKDWLKKGGLAVFEVGVGQAESVMTMLKSSGMNNIVVSMDYAGVPRTVAAEKIDL